MVWFPYYPNNFSGTDNKTYGSYGNKKVMVLKMYYSLNLLVIIHDNLIKFM